MCNYRGNPTKRYMSEQKNIGQIYNKEIDSD